MLALGSTVSGDYSIGSSKWPGTAKLLEEMGELAQVLGKIIGNGGDPRYWDGTDLRAKLIEELADVQATLLFFRDSNLTPGEEGVMNGRVAYKLEKFEEWHEKG
jgi:NTP pyrophosphatase (non-canonical NTP hydrolase)